MSLLIIGRSFIKRKEGTVFCFFFFWWQLTDTHLKATVGKLLKHLQTYPTLTRTHICIFFTGERLEQLSLRGAVQNRRKMCFKLTVVSQTGHVRGRCGAGKKCFANQTHYKPEIENVSFKVRNRGKVLQT